MGDDIQNRDSAKFIGLNNIAIQGSFDANVADVIEEIRDEIVGKINDVNSKGPVIQSCPKIHLMVKGLAVQALLDTGSEISAISKEFYKQIKARFTPVILPLTGM